MTGRFLYTNPEGHVTACSEETGRRERRRLWSVCCGITIKVVQGQEIVIYLQKKKGL